MIQKITAQQIVRSTVPSRYHHTLRGMRTRALRAVHSGRRRYCPCCKSRVRRFGAYGAVPRADARCPVCGALERHRLVSMFLEARRDELLEPAGRILHVAPEPPVAQVLRSNASEAYVTMDLCEDNVMLYADLTKLPFASHSFDGVYCSHVLEHIPDDRRAMTEMRRVLGPGGWALLQVPIKRETTIEDPTISDPGERLRRFGQEDHVRIYGRDFATRLADARFSVSIEQPKAHLDDHEIEHYGLATDEELFLCRKTA